MLAEIVSDLWQGSGYWLAQTAMTQDNAFLINSLAVKGGWMASKRVRYDKRSVHTVPKPLAKLARIGIVGLATVMAACIAAIWYLAYTILLTRAPVATTVSADSFDALTIESTSETRSHTNLPMPPSEVAAQGEGSFGTVLASFKDGGTLSVSSPLLQSISIVPYLPSGKGEVVTKHIELLVPGKVGPIVDRLEFPPGCPRDLSSTPIIEQTVSDSVLELTGLDSDSNVSFRMPPQSRYFYDPGLGDPFVHYFNLTVRGPVSTGAGYTEIGTTDLYSPPGDAFAFSYPWSLFQSGDCASVDKYALSALSVSRGFSREDVGESILTVDPPGDFDELTLTLSNVPVLEVGKDKYELPDLVNLVLRFDPTSSGLARPPIRLRGPFANMEMLSSSSAHHTVFGYAAFIGDPVGTGQFDAHERKFNGLASVSFTARSDWKVTAQISASPIERQSSAILSTLAEDATLENEQLVTPGWQRLDPALVGVLTTFAATLTGLIIAGLRQIHRWGKLFRA